jgi:enoyl-CoA hydratase/carnithine racemase
MEETVLLEFVGDGGRLALITLNRPEVSNAMNTALGARLGQVLAEVDERAAVRVAVLTGAGERAFCAGGDLKERHGMTPEQWTRQHRLFEDTARRLRELRKPVFAAVNGAAVAGGCELAMSADFIIASANARFGQSEVKVGIIPGVGGTQLLPRRLPLGRALQLLMTGELIGAEEALRLGLVNEVLPTVADLRRRALELAGAIAANSPAAIEQAKRAARVGRDLPLAEAVAFELECYRRMVDHPDRYEGVAAFNEKRAPRFQDAY